MSLCPACDTQLHTLETQGVGKVIICPDCRIPLEVINREPIELVLVPELTEGDWGD
jgi:lysine biosynthesis protein LysW